MRKALATVISLASLWAAPMSASAAETATGSAYDFSFTSIDGKLMPLANWRGKVLLVVNTASFCGFTKQYAGLQALWTKYESKGLVVVGVPSNDFGGQEPKAEGEIKKFCEGAFGITFPLTDKQAVTGSSAHPFYKWAAASAGEGGAPGWNFHKYLIGKDGRLLRSFSSRMSPDSEDLTREIESALANKSARAD
jgi:glutathione peroxidase